MTKIEAKKLVGGFIDQIVGYDREIRKLDLPMSIWRNSDTLPDDVKRKNIKQAEDHIAYAGGRISILKMQIENSIDDIDVHYVEEVKA